MKESPVDEAVVPWFGLYLNGTQTASEAGQEFTSYDPSNGLPVARVALASPTDVDHAVRAAHAAFAGWAATVPVERGRVLGRIAAMIREQAHGLGQLESLDNGKPLAQALSDIEGAARYFEFYAGLGDKFGGETIPLGPKLVSYTRREPYGVIGEILPWNAPINQAARGVAPALITGNAVVAKPATLTSTTCIELAGIATACGLPDGVFQVVTGDAEIGEALINHPLVRKVGFTGSVVTGRRVAHLAADRLIPTILELGGKSPHILFEDADLDAAIPSVYQAFTFNAGQICSAGTRLLVHDSIHEEVVARLVELAAQATLGRGVDDPDIGPLTSKDQRDKVLGYLESAAAQGAAVLPVGGAEPDTGYFVRPRILDGVTNDMTVAREEIFGPVLSVIAFSTEDAAVALANDSDFGLVAGIWTRDLGRAHRVAAALEAGQVFVNQYFAGGVETPFGGVKNSGYGRVKGIEAAHTYTYVKTVTIRI